MKLRNNNNMLVAFVLLREKLLGEDENWLAVGVRAVGVMMMILD